MAHAQDVDLGNLYVIGIRPSLASAQEVKRDKPEIVDAVVADDIGKLPDLNVAEAMQRVTGVQLSRDRGEGSSVTIRGLSQVETLLNGREIFTAGNSRILNLVDMPAESVSEIDVYKTPSAGFIAGGLGGVVDLKTYLPFDFAGKRVVATARLANADYAGKTRPQASFLASNRWRTGIGRVGALLDFSYQQRAYREDYKDSGTVVSNGQVVPGSSTQTSNNGDRTRIGVDAILQWRPAWDLSLYAELHHAQLKTREDAVQLFVSPTGVPTSVWPASGDASSATWPAASVATLGAARDTVDRVTQVALGGKWQHRALTMKADLSHTSSYSNLLYSGLYLGGANATGFVQNVGTTPQSTSLGGASLLDPASYGSATMLYAVRPFAGHMTALKLDAKYGLYGRVVSSLEAGVRLARRHADDGAGQVTFSASVPVANASGSLIANPYTDFFAGSTSINGYLVGNPDLARNVQALRDALGISSAIPSNNPLGTWTIDENTVSGYLMANVNASDIPLDGNFGLRLVSTTEHVAGYYTDTASGGTSPIAFDHGYVDALPSLNLRYRLAEGLYLRGAASKTLTRPDFNQLSPSLTLNTVQLTGSAGNPELHPIRADNYDVALEKYIGKSTSLYVTSFYKAVDGFISSVTNPETYGASTYQVTRPYNTQAASIKGFETGYQQFYDFLPGWLSGLGLQLNYTYVESTVEGSSLPLQGLSPNSCNVVGMYERGPLSIRVAYNWRDRFLSGQQGTVPIYTKGYGWLDASFRYRFHNGVTLALEGNNLPDTRRESYYGVETRPQTVWLNDRQYFASLTVDFK